FRLGGVDAPDVVPLHEKIGHGAVSAVVAAEVHGGGSGLNDLVPSHDDAGRVAMVRNNRNASDSLEPAILDRDVAPVFDPDGVHVLLRRPEAKTTDDHMAGADVEHVVALTEVDNLRRITRIASADDNRMPGCARVAERTGTFVLARRENAFA